MLDRIPWLHNLLPKLIIPFLYQTAEITTISTNRIGIITFLEALNFDTIPAYWKALEILSQIESLLALAMLALRGIRIPEIALLASCAV